MRPFRFSGNCRLAARRFSPRAGIEFLLLAAFCLLPALLEAQQAKLVVTAFDQRTGEPVTDLQAANFNIQDDRTTLRINRAEYKEDLLDVMLLIDTSLVGEMVQPLGAGFIQSLGDKEQMAMVAYHSSADLVQDFTASKDLLLGALTRVRYGNNPRVLDALYAAIDGGFQYATGRRAIVLLSAGVEGNSRVSEGEVLQLARQRNVAIYPVYVIGAERGMFRRLAQFSGGAYFDARRLELKPSDLADLAYSVVRGYYEIEVSGVFTLGHRIEVKIEGLPRSRRNVWASARPLD